MSDALLRGGGDGVGNADAALKCKQIWKGQQWLHNWKRSVFIPISKKAMANNVQTTAQLHTFHMLAS